MHKGNVPIEEKAAQILIFEYVSLWVEVLQCTFSSTFVLDLDGARWMPRLRILRAPNGYEYFSLPTVV